VAVIRDPRTASDRPARRHSGVGTDWVGAIPGERVSAAEIERAIVAFAHSPDRGLIVTSGGTGAHRNLIISSRRATAAASTLPLLLVTAACSPTAKHDEPTPRGTYVDRILRGEKRPTSVRRRQYEMVINLRREGSAECTTLLASPTR